MNLYLLQFTNLGLRTAQQSITHPVDSRSRRFAATAYVSTCTPSIIEAYLRQRYLGSRDNLQPNPLHFVKQTTVDGE